MKLKHTVLAISLATAGIAAAQAQTVKVGVVMT